MSTNGDGASTPPGTSEQGGGRSHRPGAGRGHQGRGNQGGRGRGRDSRGRNRGHTPRFRGATREIEEYTFGIHEGNMGAKKYSDNLKQLKIYAYGHCTTDVGSLFGKNPVTPTLDKPEPLDDAKKEDEMEKELYRLSLREYVEQSRKLKQDIKKMYAVILGQCTDAMINKLKALEDYDTINDDADSARLLQEIRRITFLSDEKEDPFMSAATTASKLYKLVQERESVTTYYDTWSNMAEVVKQKGGGFVNDELVRTVLNNDGSLLNANVARKLEEGKHLDCNEYKRYVRAKAKAEDRFLASLFIKGLGGQKYGKLKDELANQCSWGSNKYPADITAAYEMAINYKSTDNGRRDRQRHGNGLDGLSFLNHNDGGGGTGNQRAIPGTDGRTWYNMVCYGCGQPGHRAAVCPEGGTSGENDTNGQGGQEGVSHFMRREATVETDSETESETESEGTEEGIETEDASHEETQEVGEYGVTFSQMVKRQRGIVDQNWVLLDSQSTHSIFSNGSLLTNIRHCGHTGLTMYSNGGSQHSVMIGEYEPLGLTVWYNENSLANILAMRDTRRIVRVTMDTMITPAIAAQKYGDENVIMIFDECEIGLYRHDTANCSTLKINDEHGGFSFINTVDGNKEGFTQREIDRAIQALALYRIIGRPAERRFYTILGENHIINCPITVEDARRAFYIFGPDVATLRGKMTRKSPQAIKDFVPFELPPDLLKEFRRINLATDVFFVQGRAHQHTICRRIKFRTVERLKNMTKSEILRSLNKVIRLYTDRGFTVQQIMADNQFECLRDDLLPILLTIVGAGEHVGDIERSIRTIKEAARTTTQGLPFRRYPGLLVDAIVQKAVMDRNSFPEENGVSQNISPRTIVTGQPKVDYNDCKLELGQYCEVYTHPDPTNRQHTRSIAAIALLPSNNNGGYTFMSTRTGEKLHSYIWRALPMTRDVIRMVERLGRKENQPLINKGGLMFEWTPGDPILDDEDDEDAFDDDYESEPDADFDDDHHLDEADYDMDDDLSAIADDQRSDDEQEHDEVDEEHEDEADEVDERNDERNEQNDERNEHHQVTDTEDNIDSEDEDEDEDEAQRSDYDDNNNEDEAQRSEYNNNEDEAQRSEDNTDDAQRSEDNNDNAQRSGNTDNTEAQRSADTHDDTQESGTSQDEKEEIDNARGGRTRRNTKRHDYKQANSKGFSFLNVTDPTKVDRIKMAKHITGIVMTQLDPEDPQKKTYYWKKGIKVMGEDAIKAIVKEAKQLDDKGAFAPLKASDLNQQHKSGALESITMVTKKRCGKVKGRTCADGRKQREYMTKAEASSPTISLEGLMSIILTATHENRQVLVADIAGAYLNAEMDDFVVMKFRDEMVDYMVAANPERYAEYVTYENGRKVLYVKLLKALYGCIQSALLWYRVFTGKLMKLGYKLNKYDQCVANKQIEGSQCTVGYYVDDLIATHKDAKVLKELKSQLEEEYGEMTSTLSDDQTYLGIDISFRRDDKTAALSMKGYLQEAIEKFETIEKLNTKPANTPAKRDLFEVNEKAERLEERRRAMFHSITALLLYVCKRARPDISTAIAFLCTRPSVADVDDWRKLRRLLQYIRTTIDLELIIGADSLTAFKTFIDVAYGVHMDMKSHTGGALTFGRGVLTSKSSKQKLNVKSSTEGEVVGMSDYVAFPIWFRYFLEEQGYKVIENVVYQDNQSAMKIERNGIQSMGQKSRHIKSRYFFIKDRVEKNEIKIEYCPTEKMLADFFTKPLQGELFRRFRDVIMGHKHIDTIRVSSIKYHSYFVAKK